MNKEQAKALLPIIQAWIEGKEIEIKYLNSKEPTWLPANKHAIRFDLFDLLWADFRIKPEKKTGWIAVYPCSPNSGLAAGGYVRRTKEEAMKDSDKPIAVLQISYEEGEGLV